MSISTRPTTYDAAALERLVGGILSLYLEVVVGLNGPPEVRGKDSVVPHLAGGIPRNRKAHRRRLLLEGIVQGVGDTDAEAKDAYQALMDELDVLFATDRAVADLVVAVPDSTTRTISCRPLNWIVTEQVPGLFAELQVELESLAPSWTTT